MGHLPCGQGSGVELQERGVVLAQLAVAEAFGLQGEEDQGLQKRQHAPVPKRSAAARLIGATEVEVLANELLEEDPSADGSIEHLGERELGALG